MKFRKQYRKHVVARAIVAAAAVVGLAFAAPGCAARGSVTYTTADYRPPPPRYIDAPYRPGYIYIQGRWERHDRGWVWRDGYYARERPGAIYIQGRWYPQGNRWYWRDGYWDRRPVRHRRHVNDYYPR